MTCAHIVQFIRMPSIVYSNITYRVINISLLNCYSQSLSPCYRSNTQTTQHVQSLLDYSPCNSRHLSKEITSHTDRYAAIIASSFAAVRRAALSSRRLEAWLGGCSSCSSPTSSQWTVITLLASERTKSVNMEIHTMRFQDKSTCQTDAEKPSKQYKDGLWERPNCHRIQTVE
jgi:hypothetical protein